MKKHSTPVLLLTISLIGIAGIISCAKPPIAASNSNQVHSLPVQVRTLNIEYSNLPQIFNSPGVVQAALNSTLSAQTNATVMQVLVHLGTKVTKGEPLVYLDSSKYRAALDSAKAITTASIHNAKGYQIQVLMQTKQSIAQINAAKAALMQAQSALSTAKTKYALDLQGPRSQEKLQAELEVNRAKASLNLAKTNLKRIQYLVDRGAMPQQSLDNARQIFTVDQSNYNIALQALSIAHEGTRKLQLKLDQEMIEQQRAASLKAKAELQKAISAQYQAKILSQSAETAQAQVSQSVADAKLASISLNDSVIRAPFAGEITQRLVDPGMLATPGQPLLAVQGGALKIQTTIPESILSSVTKGETVSVFLASQANENYAPQQIKTVVDEIDPSGDSTTHTYIVKLLVQNNPQIQAGQYVKVQFPIGSQKGINIPISATWTDEGLHYVFIENQKHIARLRLIDLGPQIGNQVQVISGLAPNETIILTDHTMISDGMKVSSENNGEANN